MQGSTDRKTAIQAGLSINHDSVSKIPNRKRTGGVAEVVEHKAMSLTLVPKKKKICWINFWQSV
jgi:hypothetical protein